MSHGLEEHGQSHSRLPARRLRVSRMSVTATRGYSHGLALCSRSATTVRRGPLSELDNYKGRIDYPGSRCHHAEVSRSNRQKIHHRHLKAHDAICVSFVCQNRWVCCMFWHCSFEYGSTPGFYQCAFHLSALAMHAVFYLCVHSSLIRTSINFFPLFLSLSSSPYSQLYERLLLAMPHVFEGVFFWRLACHSWYFSFHLSAFSSVSFRSYALTMFFLFLVTILVLEITLSRIVWLNQSQDFVYPCIQLQPCSPQASWHIS
jgi:hypothetical protein